MKKKLENPRKPRKLQWYWNCCFLLTEPYRQTVKNCRLNSFNAISTLFTRDFYKHVLNLWCNIKKRRLKLGKHKANGNEKYRRYCITSFQFLRQPLPNLTVLRVINYLARMEIRRLQVSKFFLFCLFFPIFPFISYSNFQTFFFHIPF